MSNTFWIVVLVWVACSLSFVLGCWFGSATAQQRAHMDRSTPL